MKLNYKPKSLLEKFGVKIYSALVENFPQTFLVGGMVRDLYLGRKIVDIDIATEATPEQVSNILAKQGLELSNTNKKFGNIIARHGKLEVEITTLRKDSLAQNRYPQVKFIKSPKTDSLRRDFSINSLYLSLKSKEVLDFQNGLKDIKSRQIKFVGEPEKKIKQDPLRVIRALRFAIILNFNFENKSKLAIKKHFNLVNQLTKTKISKEILKIKDRRQQNFLKSILNNPKSLDKFFKSR